VREDSTTHAGIGVSDVSVGIIAARRIPELDRLVERLTTATPRPADIVVVVESSDAESVRERRDERGVRWIDVPARCGLGFNRNRLVDAVSAEVLVMVDDDCEPEADWLAELLAPLADPTVDAVVGRVDIPPSTFLGDSISALGFPAGGTAGYETMFHVGADSTTDNLATGNCAIRTSVFADVGGFDEAMVYGGEDTEFASRMNAAGKRIVYCPSAVIVHPARTSLAAFARWFYRRGRAKRQFASRASNVGSLVRNRLQSYGRILRDRARDPKIVAIAPLLVASVLLQQAGFMAEWLRPTPPRSLPLAEGAAGAGDERGVV
jgi:GT2 family glycosyltransferase